MSESNAAINPGARITDTWAARDTGLPVRAVEHHDPAVRIDTPEGGPDNPRPQRARSSVG